VSVADDVLWVLSADGEEAITTFDDIDAAVQAMGESVDAVSAAMDEQFAALTAAMDELSQMTQANAEAAGVFCDSLSTAADGAAILAESVTTDIDAIDGLNSVIDSLNTTIAEDTALISSLTEQITNLQAQISALTVEESTAAESSLGLGEALAAMGEMGTAALDALDAAMGPLMMIASVAALAGGAFLKMGLDGQKGEALLAGMAGASQQDIAALQQEAIKLGVSMSDASAGFYQVASAGYTGGDGILVFDNAMRLAEGGQARASDMMSALTGIMHAYNYSAGQSGQVTDLMAEAIVRGKQSAQDFASSIGPLAAAGKNVGFSFAEVTAAEATMTQINPHVMQDAQQLRFLFNATSLSIDGVAATAKKLKVSFDETHYKSLDLIGRLEYLAKVSGGTNTEAFKKLVGGSAGLSAALALLSGGGKAFQQNMQAMSHSTGATQGAFDQFEQTVPAHLDKVGAALSVFATRFMDAIGPKIIPIIDSVTTAITNFATLVTSHMDIVIPVIIGLSVAIGVAAVGAMISFVVASWPVILVILAIAAVVAGIILAFQHWGQIMSWMNGMLKIPAIHEIMSILQAIGGYIAAQFVPVWNQLVQMWQTQLMPLFAQLWQALQQTMPLLELIGAVIVGVLIVALGLIVGVLTGVIKGLAGFLSGLIIVIAGVVRLLTGVFQVIGGLVSFFVDLFTGHFDKLAGDLGQIWQGIVNMFMGTFQIIGGLFATLWYTVSGIVTGFVDGIIGFFTHLWDALVGHSIIPDMINGIVQWFSQLPSRAMAFVSNLVSQITSTLGSLGSKALGWAGDMINGFVNGIKGGIGAVGNAISGVADKVRQFLHFSKPDTGPLADADTYMPDMMEMMARGLTDNQHKLKQAVSGVASSLSQGLTPNITVSGASGPGGTAFGTSASTALLAQILGAIQQGRGGGTATGPANITMNNTNSFSGVSNIQQLYHVLNGLAGQAFESGQRGAY
jgi:TP901 family phage tail tape measure protein